MSVLINGTALENVITEGESYLRLTRCSLDHGLKCYRVLTVEMLRVEMLRVETETRLHAAVACECETDWQHTWDGLKV